MASQVTTLTGRGIPLPGNDIDTDRIIPARFLRCVTFDGLGSEVFKDDRAQAQGSHPFDQAAYQGAEILLVNGNFGCGSSREHAPQAIARWGIRAIVGESFAEIFFGNCLAMGIPCVVAVSEVVKQLQAEVARDPQISITIDLTTMQVRWSEKQAPLQMNEGSRGMLLSGSWDACGQLLASAPRIREVATDLPYLRWGVAP
ncbi:MAG: 3-isopropylmalate dehydratase small subunit [Cyanobacteriota bacterium]|nr:3-isopropylmalate dehydratase small subunit [Cyanobacteriota bacterium]